MGVSRWDKLGRILVVLLVLVSFVAVQAASATEIFPDHHGPDDRCCAGGHAGHFPVLVSVSAAHIQTLSVAGWRANIEVAADTSDDGRTFNSSRAPPV
jgi:hypothetical protein